MADGIVAALNHYCFFISSKCRDEEIQYLKNTTVKAATSLKKKQPIYIYIYIFPKSQTGTI